MIPSSWSNSAQKKPQSKDQGYFILVQNVGTKRFFQTSVSA
jgi:hypothetical protein